MFLIPLDRLGENQADPECNFAHSSSIWLTVCSSCKEAEQQREGSFLSDVESHSMLDFASFSYFFLIFELLKTKTKTNKKSPVR